MYAQDTSVPVERSRSEIESLVVKYGAKKFATGYDEEAATILFECQGRRVRFRLPFPDFKDELFWYTKHSQRYQRKKLSEGAARSNYDKEIRRRWRCLALSVKAKLESVQTGIATFDEEFLSYIVMPDGKTVGESARPQLEKAYSEGVPVALLPGW
jgi:hypothetical protein